jgi:class 3 adenylate cyclase
MSTTRRLAAILAADVAGYSRLMGTDEEGTLAALKAIRRDLADPKIEEHRGRIVKTTGDGLLVEFASVVDAVRCAVELQQAMTERNADVPSEKRIEFRIGINLGDVILDEGDIYGDGVNIAARLEALAEPGEICVSRVVHDQVRDRLDIAFEDRGERQVKNIARPVHVYRIPIAGHTTVPVPQGADTVSEGGPAETSPRRPTSLSGASASSKRCTARSNRPAPGAAASLCSRASLASAKPVRRRNWRATPQGTRRRYCGDAVPRNPAPRPIGLGCKSSVHDRLGINGGVVKPVSHRQTFYGSCYRSIIR